MHTTGLTFWLATHVPTPFNTTPSNALSLSGTASLIDQISGTLLWIIAPMSLLGIITGALLFTTVGWSQESKHTGQVLLRVSAVVLVVAVLALSVVQMLLYL